MDIDGQETERFDIRLAPNPAATIEQEALDVAGVTLEQVQSYQPMEEGYRQLVGILSKYVNKFDKRDKMYLVGYNSAGFDNNFLRALFTQCGDKYFGSWFYPNCMDVYVMVTPFLMGVRNDMENFKLMTVARTMGIEIDENKLHDATYDIELTRDIFYRIIGKMDDKIDEILDLLKSQNEMIKDIHDYVKEVTSEKYIADLRMTSFSINLAADILTEAISPKIKGMMVDLLRKQGWKTE